jgi:hypothetical protein
MSYAAHASQLLEELESGWLEVCKCPSNQGGYIRVPVSVNSEWYRKFCAQFEQRRRKYPKPRTIIKRCHVIRALRKIIAGVESDGVYVGRLMDCIERSTANMAQRELTIDREFSSLNGPLTEEERGHLRELLINEGCRDPIITWANHDDTILDGYNRYDICTAEGIPFTTKALHFDNRADAQAWIARTQLGRRNATEERKAYLRGKLYHERKQPHGGQTATPSSVRSGNSCHSLTADSAHTPSSVRSGNSCHSKTEENIAAETGVSARTIRNDAAFAESVDALIEKSPELAAAALAGQIDKKDVPALAEQSKADLKRIERAPSKERRKAAKELVSPKEITEADAEEDDTTAAVMARNNSAIESFCRRLTTFAHENMPDDPWLRHMNRRDGAMQKIKDACEMLRTCKCVKECPKCEGTACAKCLRTGRVTRYALDQMQ